MIGLCTSYKINNYGTKLQAYAVQEKIKELGYDFEIINFDRRSDMRINKLCSRYLNYHFIKSKIRSANDRSKVLIKDKLKIRIDAINSFDSTHYKTTKLIKGYHALNEYSKKFEALICGSDQIWLPSNINNPTAILEFGSDNIRRIAFAPSFGIEKLPNNKKKQYKKFLSKFNYLSVREQAGQKIIKDLIGKDIPVISDPTLSVSKSVWDNLIKQGRKEIHEKYVFCYFLGSNEEHRKKVYEIAKRENLKIITLPHFKEYNECDEKYTDLRLYDVTPVDFIQLISNAEYVFTDSFHSTVFSILYHKNFYVFERYSESDKKSANSRIYSLLNILGIEERLLSPKNNYDEPENKIINYDIVDQKLSLLREKTDDYLKKSLSGLSQKNEEKVGFQNLKKDNCCGCSACSNICPKNCITMVKEDETGFSYPQLTNENDCIKCGLCNKVCPNMKERNYTHKIGKAYHIINLDKNVRKTSSSGGVFYPLANKILNQNGYVCGAIFDDTFNVKHIITNKKEDIEKMMRSKYSESCLGNTFYEVKQILDEGTLVLFTGTPCQVAGLKSYLMRDYQNLITMDLLC